MYGRPLNYLSLTVTLPLSTSVSLSRSSFLYTCNMLKDHKILCYRDISPPSQESLRSVLFCFFLKTNLGGALKSCRACFHLPLIVSDSVPAGVTQQMKDRKMAAQAFQAKRNHHPSSAGVNPGNNFKQQPVKSQKWLQSPARDQRSEMKHWEAFYGQTGGF